MSKATLQQERSRATRKAIMAAAEELWRTRGFDSVSVDDVCQTAGVAKGTFYFYFARKEHLLVMLVFSKLYPRESEVQTLLESEKTTIDVCREIATAIADRAVKLDPSLTWRAIDLSFASYQDIAKLEGGDRYLRDYLLPVFLRGQQRGEIVGDWDPNTIAPMLAWSLLQGVNFWGRGAISTEDLADNLCQRTELIARGAAQARGDCALPRRSAPVHAGQPAG
jgi:AcrR family transcriptional regulator